MAKGPARSDAFSDCVRSMVVALRADRQWSQVSDERLLEEIAKRVSEDALLSTAPLSDQGQWIDQIYATIRGYDVLDFYMDQEEITEIMVNDYDEIFYEKNGQLFCGDRHFESKERFEDMIQKIVSDAGRAVNRRKPICDCRMRDGARVNVVLEPIAAHSPVLTIRRFGKEVYTLDDLVQKGSFSAETAEFLSACVRARMNLFISGGTGSGKTTLLNALSLEIPKEERLITIEDARELNFQGRANWVALEARMANAAGEGAVRIRDLIRASLRMRPDRIIVGEVRGPEAIDMLQALNTGHDGSLSSGHANSVEDMQFRLETMVMSGQEGLPLQAIRQQIGSAIDLFIHLSRMPDHSRKLVSIKELYVEEGQLRYHPLFEKSWHGPPEEVAAWTGHYLKNPAKFYREGVSSPLVEGGAASI